MPLAAHPWPWPCGVSLPPACPSPGFCCQSPADPEPEAVTSPLGSRKALPSSLGRTPAQDAGWARLSGLRTVSGGVLAPVGTRSGLLRITETPPTYGLNLHHGFKKRDCPAETRAQTIPMLVEPAPPGHWAEELGPGSQSLRGSAWVWAMDVTPACSSHSEDQTRR